MRHVALAAAILALAAAPVAAQYHPSKGTVAQLGVCALADPDGGPRIKTVTDGASSSDCTVGGGVAVHICFCDGSSWATLAEGGAGASALDDLTDVATTGADSGEALAYTGTAWAPTAAAVIQEGDARLTDARAPTLHAASHEDGGTDTLDLTDLTGLTATPQTPAAHAPAHSLGGTDPVTATDLASGCTDAQVLGGTAAGTGVECQADDAGTDDQGAAEVPFTPAGGVAATDVQAAIEEVDAEHTTDTGPSPDCAGTSTYQDGEGGCDTVGGDLSGGLDALALVADSVGLDELAACVGPDEIVEYGASGVPACIATPSGGGGGIGGSTGATDNAVLCADGTGGATIQSCDAGSATIGDSGDLTLSAGRLITTGFGTSSFIAGSGATDNGGAQSIVLGTNADAAGGENVVIGGGANADSASVAIGRLASTSGATNSNAVAIGRGATSAIRAISLGHSASGAQDSVAIGYQASASADASIAIGRGASATAGQVVFGSSVDGMTSLRLVNTGGGTDWTLSGNVTTSGADVNDPKARTCADSGDLSAGFLSVTTNATSYAEITNSDADGCTAVLSESGAVRGQRLTVSVPVTAGGTVDFADSAGVQETGAGCSLSINGVAGFVYATTDRWLLVSCQPTN